MTALEYAGLPTLDDVAPLTAEDEDCLNELRGVLARHGRLDRFGVALLHRHFDLDEGEILVEECDTTRRTLTTSPRRSEDFPPERRIETVWRFDGHGNRTCVKNCNSGICSHDHQ
jgi:hypothetical protein